MPTTLHEPEADLPAVERSPSGDRAGVRERSGRYPAVHVGSADESTGAERAARAGSGSFELPSPGAFTRPNGDDRVPPQIPGGPRSSSDMAAASREASGGPRTYASMQMQAIRPEPSAPSRRSLEEHGPPAGRMLDDELEFMGVGDAVVLEVDALPAGHMGYDTVAGHVPPPSSRLARTVRFTPQPMEAVQPPRDAGRSTPWPGAMTPPDAVRSSSGEMPAPARPSRETRAIDPSSARTPSAATWRAAGAPEREPASARRPSGELPAVAPAVSAAAPRLAGDPRAPGIRALSGYGAPPEKLLDTPAYALRVLARQRILRRELAVARDLRTADVELYEAALRCADRPALERGLALVGAGVTSVLGAIIAVAVVLLG